MNGTQHHHRRGDSDDGNKVIDGHEHDLAMPGFRFHPTEEELVEFYLRRKVEGKSFNVEIIRFLDLYRYDPWELPALALMGEKEWFFYVPRDRKYRNGDRPNRVTTSGYWKATGADRTIKTESLRSIGLKKTLVFYSGKAPKGVRTSWIMNEYRLPQSETERYQKAEISLCRVYKRSGVEDHHQLSGTQYSSCRPSSSRGMSRSSKKQGTSKHRQSMPAAHPFQSARPGDQYSSSEMDNAHQAALSMVAHDVACALPTLQAISSATPDEDASTAPLNHSEDMNSLVSACTLLSSSSSSLPTATVDELDRLVAYHQGYSASQINSNLFPLPLSTSQLPPLTTLPSSLAAFTDRLWEWNPIPEADRDYTASSFK